MVELMLHCPRQEPLARHLDVASESVLRHHPDTLVAVDIRDVAGDGEATLEIAIVAGAARDPRIDELMQLAADLDDAGLQRFADLRRSEPHARSVAHRFGQVVQQLVEGLAEAVDGLPLQSKARVAEEDDRSDAHWSASIANDRAASGGPRSAVASSRLPPSAGSPRSPGPARCREVGSERPGQASGKCPPAASTG